MPRFTAKLMDHFNDPRNWGELKEPTVIGSSSVSGGARQMTLHLRIERRVVAEVAYKCHGCGVTIACGSALTELVNNQPLAAVCRIDKDDIINELDGVPSDKRHCANLVHRALQDALSQLSDSAGDE